MVLRHLGYQYNAEIHLHIWQQVRQGKENDFFLSVVAAENTPITKQALVHRGVSLGAEVEIDIEMYFTL